MNVAELYALRESELRNAALELLHQRDEARHELARLQEERDTVLRTWVRRADTYEAELVALRDRLTAVLLLNP